MTRDFQKRRPCHVCYDCFGNERVVSAADGIYEFKADEKPQYIVGDFTGVAVNAVY